MELRLSLRESGSSREILFALLFGCPALKIAILELLMEPIV